MTRNITLAFVFTLASVLLLFFIWYSETHRLPHATSAAAATKLEFGQRQYEQYCASCHGLVGEGLVGPPLNTLAERKGPGTEEFTQANGIKQKYGTLANYVEATISAGVRGTMMPAWAVEFGGPMRHDQVDAVMTYVMYMQGGTLTDAAVAAGEEYQTQVALAQGPRPTSDPSEPVSAGDAARGEQVFNAGCNACHSTGTNQLVGPGLQGMFNPGGPPGAPYGDRLANGQPITPESVAQWIRDGGRGQIGVMPPMGGMQLSEQDIVDLVAYLQTLK